MWPNIEGYYGSGDIVNAVPVLCELVYLFLCFTTKNTFTEVEPYCTQDYGVLAILRCIGSKMFGITSQIATENLELNWIQWLIGCNEWFSNHNFCFFFFLFLFNLLVWVCSDVFRAGQNCFATHLQAWAWCWMTRVSFSQARTDF